MPLRAKKSHGPSKKSKVAQPEAHFSFRLTHPERVVYPDEGITKRDLASYYVTVADWMLPHVADRPLAIVRCPEGMSGQCFFQKHPSPGMDAIDRVKITEKSGTADYVVVRDWKGLIALVQFARWKSMPGDLGQRMWNILTEWCSISIPIRRCLGNEWLRLRSWCANG